MKGILVLGSNGSLGSSICKELRKNKFLFYSQSRSNKNKYYCNFNNTKSFLKLLQQTKPKIIINTISNINIKNCEKNILKCFKDNILTAFIISKICGEKKIKQIYISTDHLYSEKKLSLEKNINPMNNYSYSKFIAEQFVLENHGVVLRVNFIHKDKKKRTFHDQVISKKSKKNYLYKNIFFNPLHISTLAKIIVLNLRKLKKGVYNVGSKDKISKEKFILQLCKFLKLKRNFECIDYIPGKIQRPLDMSMNVNKITRLLKIKKYDVLTEIRKLSKEYK